MNTAVTLICFALFVFDAIYILINVLSRKGEGLIRFLRSFKKGRFAFIYVSALPLYIIGIMYGGKNFLDAFFEGIHRVVNLAIMKYEITPVEALMNDNTLYAITVYFCFFLAGVNAILFTVSLALQYIWSNIQKGRAMNTTQEKLFLIGNNENNINIYNTASVEQKFIIDSIDGKGAEALYLSKTAFLSHKTLEESIGAIFRFLNRSDNKCTIIVNTGNDEKNIRACKLIIDGIDGYEDLKSRAFDQLCVYVFGDRRYETVYADILRKGYGCINYINKYDRIAMDFIDRYPLTRFMGEEHVDYSTSLVRDGVEINVALIGFGKTNQQIFLTSIANNQFLTHGEGEPTLKKVNYYVLDKEKTFKDKNLNHTYFRYESELTSMAEEDYLPLPSVPANTKSFECDVNDPDFYPTLRDLFTRSKRDVCFAVIAFGTDLENIDMAQKLCEKRREWGVSDNLVIFVKASRWTKDQTLMGEKNCFFIGNEMEILYDYDKIINDTLTNMALMRNEVYDLEYDITSINGLVVDREYLAKNREKARRGWHDSKTQLQRDSSVYCCLSLRSKLNLMGLDYVPLESEGEALSESEYIEIYAGKDKPEVLPGVLVDGKSVIAYTLDFADSRRRTMAIHEHQRWNSFMISRGMVPATREQILNERGDNGKFTNGKNFALRRHGNLTTFEGLVEFRQLVSKRDGVSEESKDVIKYDYQLLDDAHWLVSKNNCKIVKR